MFACLATLLGAWRSARDPEDPPERLVFTSAGPEHSEVSVLASNLLYGWLSGLLSK